MFPFSAQVLVSKLKKKNRSAGLAILTPYRCLKATAPQCGYKHHPNHREKSQTCSSPSPRHPNRSSPLSMISHSLSMTSGDTSRSKELESISVIHTLTHTLLKQRANRARFRFYLNMETPSAYPMMKS